MRAIVVLAAVITAMACRPTRTVKVGWDAPTTAPDRYRIFVDDHIVLDIPPPPIDPSCHCLNIAVTVPSRGRHTVSVVAYNRIGGTSEAASVVVQ